MKYRSILLLAVATTLVATAVIWWTSTRSSDEPLEHVAPGVVRFSGKIDSVRDERPSDGNLVVTVAERDVVVQAGGLEPPGTPPLIRGQVSGLLEVGKAADVRARQLDANSFTIYGSSELYIRTR